MRILLCIESLRNSFFFWNPQQGAFSIVRHIIHFDLIAVKIHIVGGRRFWQAAPSDLFRGGEGCQEAGEQAGGAEEAAGPGC